MTKEEFIVLADKIADGEANIAEIALYNTAYDTFQQDQPTWTEMDLDPKPLKEQSLNAFWNQNNFKPKLKTKLWFRMAVAAAALIAIVSGLYLFSYINNEASKSIYANDIAPGHNQATLTLLNGNKIALSATKVGVVINAQKLAYSDGSKIEAAGTNEQKPTADFGMNTLETPKGGFYQIILADGTKVWLNAYSILKFPTSFEGLANRNVSLLRGEAYFEVAKDKKHPFIVDNGVQKVEVLGTHFNINSYANDGSIETTLLEGIVNIENTKSKQKKQLKPGEQSKVINGTTEVKNIDTEGVIAWKNGYFNFVNQNIKDVMNSLSLWYNLEVVYESADNMERFNGKISRDKNISQVLHLFEGTKGIKFKVEGRRVTVIQ